MRIGIKTFVPSFSAILACITQGSDEKACGQGGDATGVEKPVAHI